jgi:hypothetical protein
MATSNGNLDSTENGNLDSTDARVRSTGFVAVIAIILKVVCIHNVVVARHHPPIHVCLIKR